MHASETVDSRKSLLSLCAMHVVSIGAMQIQPMLGGALVDQWGFSLQAIGTTFATELTAMAVACVVGAMLMPHVNRRRFVLSALGALALGNLASTMANNVPALLACRLLSGLGAGGVMAVVYATAALRQAKDPTFAAINAGNLIWGMLLVSSAPWILQAGGIAGIFCLLGGVAALALYGSAFIPPRGSTATARPVKDLLTPNALMLIALFTLLFFGHSALWVYQERIGTSIGLPPKQIGAILGGSILAGALGAALAGVLKRRLGLLFPQLFGFGLSLAATLLMVHGSSLLAFAATAVLLHLAWFLCLPYLFSMTAELDPTGRLSGLGNAAIFVGQGLGPFGAALVVGDGNFRAVGWLAAATYLIAGILACVVIARLRPQLASRPQPSAG